MTIKTLVKFWKIFEFPNVKAVADFQQAVIRLVILASITIYFSLHYHLAGEANILEQPIGLLTAYDAISILILFSFKPFPNVSHFRRSFTLVSERPYKHAWSVQTALEHMESQRGKHFDPQCLDAFKSQIDSVTKIQNMLPDYPAVSQ